MKDFTPSELADLTNTLNGLMKTIPYRTNNSEYDRILENLTGLRDTFLLKGKQPFYSQVFGLFKSLPRESSTNDLVQFKTKIRLMWNVLPPEERIPALTCNGARYSYPNYKSLSNRQIIEQVIDAIYKSDVIISNPFFLAKSYLPEFEEGKLSFFNDEIKLMDLRITDGMVIIDFEKDNSDAELIEEIVLQRLYEIL